MASLTGCYLPCLARIAKAMSLCEPAFSFWERQVDGALDCGQGLVHLGDRQEQE